MEKLSKIRLKKWNIIIAMDFVTKGGHSVDRQFINVQSQRPFHSKTANYKNLWRPKDNSCQITQI